MVTTLQIMPSGDVYVADGPPSGPSKQESLLERVRWEIIQYNDEWGNPYEVAQDIIDMVLAEASATPTD